MREAAAINRREVDAISGSKRVCGDKSFVCLAVSMGPYRVGERRCVVIRSKQDPTRRGNTV